MRHECDINARALLGVADLAGVVDVLRRKIDFGGAHLFRVGKAALAIGSNLSPFLRGVIFVREAPLRQGFDLKRVCLVVRCASLTPSVS